MEMKGAAVSSLLLLVIGWSQVASERTYDEVIFTTEKCNTFGNGMADEFDVCAILEFCSSDDYYDDRQLVISSESIDGDFHEEVKKAKSINTAAYGYRIEGSPSCSWPGPIMRLKRGVKHGLFLRGGETATNLHFHGLHVKALGNGDSMHRSVEGEKNMLIYEIDLPHDKHLGGTHWYHSHFHGASWDQVKGGAFGMITIDDNGHEVGTEDKNVLEFLNNEKVIVVDNSHRSKYTANGLSKETLEFTKNEWYRLRILAVSVDSHKSGLAVNFGGNCRVHAIAHDGIFRFKVPAEAQESTFKLTPSSRLDVAIQCSGDENLDVYGHVIAQINVDTSKQASSATPFEGGSNAWNSHRLEYVKDLTTSGVDHDWKVKVDETNINNVSPARGEPLCTDSGHDFIANTIQEWELRGVGTHPFHVHIHPMQVMTEGCAPHVVGEYYDTITAPESSMRNKCLVRLNLVDISGPTTVHCHIFEHADHGALAEFHVLDGSSTSSVDGPTCIGTCTDPDPLPTCTDMNRRKLRGTIRR